MKVENILEDIALERSKSKRKIEVEQKIQTDLTNILTMTTNLCSPVGKENLLKKISELMYELKDLSERKTLRDNLSILYDEIEKKTF